MLSRNTYFFTDLHADRDALDRSLDMCEDAAALYLFGGDCLDKGPSNLDLLTEIRSLAAEVDVKILAGNHDLRMLMVLMNWEQQGESKYERIFTPKRYEKRITPFLDECGGIESARKMFLNPEGEFHWFFDSLNLLHIDNGLLFVHAGVGDEFVSELRTSDPLIINHKFHDALSDSDKLYDLYYGPLGTAFRTKYRDDDYPFTIFAAKNLFNMGIKCIVHGHDNQTHGHDLEFRHGILHLKCDTTLDQNTRKQMGLRGEGYSVAIFDEETPFIQCYSSESAIALDLEEYLGTDFSGHL